MSLIKLRSISLLICMIIILACGNNNQQPTQGPPPAIAVTLDTAKIAETVYFDEYPATIVALNQVELRPQVSGFITGVHFTDGSRVKKGQLLYSIDQQLYSANYQQAVANLHVQEA